MTIIRNYKLFALLTFWVGWTGLQTWGGDVQLHLDLPESNAVAGTPYPIRLTVENVGPGAASGIQLSLPLQDAVQGGSASVQSVSVAAGRSQVENNNVAWQLDALEEGLSQSIDLMIDLVVDENEESALFMVTPVVTVFEVDPDITNNFAERDVHVAVSMDFGDAPDHPYPTLKASNGARHRVVSGWHLGQTIDHEEDGQRSYYADGDDLNGRAVDDEDGVFFNTPLVMGQQDTGVQVISSTNGFLDAWIDFDKNGVWERDEQVFNTQPLVPGLNHLRFNMRVDAELGATFSRWRMSEYGGLRPDGYAAKGEVEDYYVTIQTHHRTNDLIVLLGAYPGDVEVAEPWPVQLTVENQGVEEASGVEVVVDVRGDAGQGVAIKSAVPSQGSCQILEGRVVCSLGRIVSLGAATVQIDAVPQAEGSFTALASVTAFDPDPDLSNNRTSAVFSSQYPLDYGDAPDGGYPTLLANDGARHRIVPGWHLGRAIDRESDGQPGAGADLDDGTGRTDDEDGVLFGRLIHGKVGIIFVEVSTNGVLDVWIDLNRNGAWETGEHILDGRAVTMGINVISFAVPSGGITAPPTGDTFARVRFTDVGIASPGGLAMMGEVEDYRVTIRPATESYGLRFFWYEGNLILHWDEEGSVLEQADAVTGPWAPLLKATSPYHVPLSDQMKYFKLGRRITGIIQD